MKTNLMLFGLLFVILTSINSFAQIPPFSGGSGTQADPYLISSKENLEELADSVLYGVMQGNGDNWSNGKYFSLTYSITDTVRRPIGALHCSVIFIILKEMDLK